MERVIYTERQTFNRFYYLMTVGVGVFLAWALYQDYLAGRAVNYLAIAISVLLLIVVVSMRQKTIITDKEVRTGFPFWMRAYSLDGIREAYTREYDPIGEFGGWGIRRGGGGRAFNTSGNKGLQLVFKNGKRVLIGTQQPELIELAMREVLNGKGEELDLEAMREKVELRERG